MDAQDYRSSHQQSGAHYDSTLFTTPFDAYMDRWEAQHLAALLPRLYPARIPRYLDFACGTGRITQRVAPLAVESVGVDVSESMLEGARAKCPGTRFLCVDLTRRDTGLGLFDLVTSFRFFGNAQDELRTAALGAIARHVRPGGHLVINNHRNPGALMDVARRMSGGAPELDLSHAKLRTLLRKHGFDIVEAKAIGFWLFRARLLTAQMLESPRAARFERLFGGAAFVPRAPDALLVARKVA